jgi:hypothetical protein
MAQYRVLVDSAIGTGLVKAGTIIEYDGKSEGKPGPNLELVKGLARTARVSAGAELVDTTENLAGTTENPVAGVGA